MKTFLCLVPANLLIARLRRRTVLQVHALEDGVFAEFLFDGQHRLQHPPFPGQFRRVRFRVIVREKAQLLIFRSARRGRFVNHMIGRDGKPPHQQIFIDDSIKQVGNGLQNPL